MTTLPEEVKNAVAKALRESRWLVPAPAVELILTAAAPFLPVQGAVKKLEWELVSGDHYAEGSGTHYNIYETRPDFWNCVTVKPVNVRLATNVSLEDAKAAAQADYEARILSALEPSAAHKLALEEGFCKGLEAACEVIDAHSEYDRRMCCDGRECGCYGATVHQSMQHYIRALSSTDHADAGKVEGDGSRWRVFEAAVGGYWGIELEQASNDDDPILYPIKVHRDTLARIVDAHNAALPSAPSGGAE